MGVSSSMMCPLRWRCVLAAPGAASRLVVSLSGEASAYRLISASSGWAGVPVMPSRGRCLLAPASSGDGAVPFSSSAFPPAPYHPMAAGRGAVRRPHFGSSLPASHSRRLSLLPRAAHSIRGGRDGRRGGWCLLGYYGVAHHASSMNVYNEYDVCDVYKRYKDTKIREYDGYMR